MDVNEKVVRMEVIEVPTLLSGGRKATVNRD